MRSTPSTLTRRRQDADKTYFPGPGGEEAAKPYACCATREVRDPRAEIDNLPAAVRLSRQEVRMARQLVDSMSGPWTPSDYRDTYTDRVNDLIEAKKNDKGFQSAAEPPAAINVSDLARRPGRSTASQRHSPPKCRAATRRFVNVTLIRVSIKQKSTSNSRK